MNQKSIEDQLMQLKAVTIRTGAIHEAQRIQLQRWPLLSAQIQVPVIAKVAFKTKTVTLECKSKIKAYKHGAFEKRLFDEICGWTRTILWNETKVIIKVNGKVRFDSAAQ